MADRCAVARSRAGAPAVVDEVTAATATVAARLAGHLPAKLRPATARVPGGS
jgi:hypothetical protein